MTAKLWFSPPLIYFIRSKSQVDSLEATQEWALTEDHDGSKRYETLISKWNGVRSLTLYIPRNFGADTTKIYYIGLRGDVTKVSVVTEARGLRVGRKPFGRLLTPHVVIAHVAGDEADGDYHCRSGRPSRRSSE